MNASEFSEIKTFLEKQLETLEGHVFEVTASASPDPNDLASMVADSHIQAAINARVAASLGEVQDALRRMECVSYGYCEECGEEIGLARLKARPAARTCVHCQLELEEAV